MRTSIILLMTLLPLSAAAELSINEVAWMGSTASANHEWIELYNSGLAAVSVDGFTLKDGMNLAIELTGTIAGQSYAVLERTSDDSAPGSAFLIYTGALVNTGATLTLYNQGGTIVDQVAGGENWQNIGGDNLTKETAQYTRSGWITAAPTPGAENRTEGTPPPPPPPPPPDPETGDPEPTPSPTSSNSGTTRARGSDNSTVRLVVPNTVLKLRTDIQSIAYVNQPITLEVSGSGIGETILDSLVYTWNFGDSFSAVGKSVKHAYSYPGTYIITVHAAYGRHSQIARHEITILPTSISITRNQQHDVQIHNDAPYDVDVSGFLIRGDHRITLPPYSILPPKGTLTIAAARLESRPGGSMVGVYDQAATLIASTHHALAKSLPHPVVAAVREEYTPESVLAVTAPAKSPATTNAFAFKVAEAASLGEATLPEATDSTTTTALFDTTATEEPQPLPISPSAKPVPWSYIALCVLIGATLAAIYKRPTKATELS